MIEGITSAIAPVANATTQPTGAVGAAGTDEAFGSLIRGAVERLAIGLLTGNPLEFAASAVDPAVIEAAEKFAGALVFAAYQVAPVAAGVHQDADLAVVAVRQNNRPPGYGPRHEIARLWKFRDMTGEKPAPIKNPRPLLLEDFVIDKYAAVDAENAVFAVVELLTFHDVAVMVDEELRDRVDDARLVGTREGKYVIRGWRLPGRGGRRGDCHDPSLLVVWSVPAALREHRGIRSALRRGLELGRADAWHSIGGIATLGLVYLLTRYTLVILLHTQGNQTEKVAAVLSEEAALPETSASW